jgi:hypothetical protein
MAADVNEVGVDLAQPVKFFELKERVPPAGMRIALNKGS